MNSSYPKDLIFDQGKPFFDYVSAYITAVSGLVSIADPVNLMQFRLSDVVTIEGKVVPELSVSPLSVHKQFISGKISAQHVTTSLTCMLLNTAYESVAHLNDKSPEFEFFRHARHAASHGNRFRFLRGEPKQPAYWRNVCIDHTRREKSNPLHGQVCRQFNFKCGCRFVIVGNRTKAYGHLERKLIGISRGQEFRFLLLFEDKHE